MNRDRDRKSRFGPPNSSGPARMSNFAASNQQNTRNSYKTPEQLAFDKEFEKWEESFEQWKKSFANHPDRNAYRQYENKFLDVRDKLIAKRKQIYDNRSTPSIASAPFENQLSAADAMANSILSKFGAGSGDGGMDIMDRRSDNYRPGGGGSVGGYRDNNQMDYRSRDRSGSGPPPGNFGRSFSGNRERGGGQSNRGGDFGGRRDDFNNRGGNNNGRNQNQMQNRGGYNSDQQFRGGRNNDQQFRGGGRNDDRRGGRGGFSGGRNDRFGNREQGGGGGGRFTKPSQAQIEKELKRDDVYPFNKWQLCGDIQRPKLVGKRAKKKNAKILNFLERKRKIESGEVPLEELPFGLRIEKQFEIAKSVECPTRLPGSMSRKLKTVKAKNPNTLTVDERKFLAYAEYVIVKRAKYYEQKKLEEAATAQKMEGVSEINAIATMAE